MKRILLAVMLCVSTVASAWTPSLTDKMYINYAGQFATTNVKYLAATVANIDLFDNTATRIAALKATGRPVICYFSAGSSENWRPDYAAFPEAVKGNPLDGWVGEKWLDIRSVDVVNIMKARIDLAATRGCDAVDPDNTDGFDGNNTGFPLTQLDTQTYLATLSNYAHSKGLKIGLKNNPNIVNLMFTYFDFAVVEQCLEYTECNMYAIIINQYS